MANYDNEKLQDANSNNHMVYGVCTTSGRIQTSSRFQRFLTACAVLDHSSLSLVNCWFAVTHRAALIAPWSAFGSAIQQISSCDQAEP